MLDSAIFCNDTQDERDRQREGVLGVTISIDIARRVLEASKQRARELRSPVSIAIVDAGGHLVLFERMMSPYGWATANISIAKANTAVMFNQPTDAVAQWGAAIPGFASSLSSMTDGKFIMAAGGWPIRLNGVTIGGIGVSGGNAPGRDDEIARAGLGALEALSPAIAPQPAAQPAQSVSSYLPTVGQPFYTPPSPSQSAVGPQSSQGPGGAAGPASQQAQNLQSSFPSQPANSNRLTPNPKNEPPSSLSGTHYLPPEQDEQFGNDSFQPYSNDHSGDQK